MHEQEVLDYGHVASLALSADVHHHLCHWGEHFQAGFCQVVDGEVVGVPALEVAHHKPARLGVVHKRWDFDS